MANKDSFKQRQIKLYRSLHYRKYREKNNLVVLEGFQLLNEAVRAGLQIKTVIYTSDFAEKKESRLLLEQIEGANYLLIDAKTFNKIAQTENPQGIGAIARAPGLGFNFLLDREKSFYLVLDGIQDPGNMGTIIRTAAAAAVDGVILLPGAVDPFNPKALRASMGGSFFLPLALLKSYEEWTEICQRRHFQVIATDPEGDFLFHEIDFRLPSAVIIGNENKGLSREAAKTADKTSRIPINGEIASLNAAIAASVFIFERARQIS